MSSDVRTMREKVRELWDDAHEGWRKWEPVFGYSSWPVTQKMLGMMGLERGARVLDVGCGTGDPALQIAAALGSRGSVQGIDLSAGMIETARERARALQIGNASFDTGAVEDFASRDCAYDVISARFAIIFFADVPAGLGRMYALLRPGGRAVVSTWAPHEENPMFAIPAEAVSRVVELPELDPNKPGPMRLSRPGELETALAEAGFVDIVVERVRMYFFAMSLENYWEVITALSGSLAKVLGGLSAEDQARIRDGALELASAHERHGVVRIPAVARVACGIKLE